MSPPDPTHLDLGDPPDENDLPGKVMYFKRMLDVLAQKGTPETKRVHENIVKVFHEFGRKREANEPDADDFLKGSILAIEIDVAVACIRSLKRMRDRAQKQARKLGRGGSGARQMRAAAEGLQRLIEAMQMLQEGARAKDEEKRRQANIMLIQARRTFEQGV